MLNALIANDGDSMMLRADEIPFMVCDGKKIDVSPRPLPRETVERIACYLLSADHRTTLEEVGGARCHLPRLTAFPDEDFTILAGEPGPDFWMKILRDSANADWVPPDLFSLRHQKVASSPPGPAAPIESPVGKRVFVITPNDVLPTVAVRPGWPKFAG